MLLQAGKINLRNGFLDIGRLSVYSHNKILWDDFGVALSTSDLS